MNSEPPIINISKLNFSYNDNPVLENVNLEIVKGELASIVGPNGGGKTTLLKLILGLLKPVSGSLEIFGMTPAKARRKIGYMPQHAQLDPQFPISVLDVVLMGQIDLCGKGLFGGFPRRAATLAKEALAEVGLAEHTQKSFSELSGGQRQRVLIARALCSEPELLLLDEPTSNIDPRSEENLYATLTKLNRKMTILLVSHDLGFVSQIVKSVICVNRQVIIHPTSKINGTIIKEIYGGDFNLIRHDHRCDHTGHSHHDPFSGNRENQLAD
jgi:zinc transport system ATP-binding protein